MGAHSIHSWLLRKSTKSRDVEPFDPRELSAWNQLDAHARRYRALARERRQRNARADARWLQAGEVEC